MTSTLPIDTPLSTFIEEQIKDTFYYDNKWLGLIAKLYGYQIIRLTSRNISGEITGFLPLCFIKSPLTGRRLVSLPFSDHCPLLAVDEASANDLISQAMQLTQRYNVKYLELRTGPCDALAKHPDFVANNLYVNWSIPLANNSTDAWSNLRKPVQQQIKKSQKLGVQVRVAQNREDMLLYYRLHIQTRTKKHGMPSQTQSYFLALWDAFADSGSMQLLLAEYQGVPIAGVIMFMSGTTMHYAYGASDEQYLNLAPNNLLFWTAIMWGSAHGYQSMDLGRTARDNRGLMEFKRRWGAIQEDIPYYYYPSTAGLASTSESSWQYNLLTSIWRKLPLAVTGRLGGYFYRHLG